jgi:glycosyltransferase involved in cell wall biosynthesis
MPLETTLLEHFPSVSVIVPVFNSARTLKECLASIEKQEYPRNLVEVIIVDGGSTDSTLRIAEEMPNVVIARNSLRSGEAGKATGANLAKHELLAFVDSDNVLDDPLWLQKMTRPFSDPSIAASEPLFFNHRPKDPLVTRYCALIGANDPLTVYVGNYDRFSYLRKQWTEVPVRQKDCGDYISVDLSGKLLPTFGANGFLVSKKLVHVSGQKSFLFDLDLVQTLAEGGGLRIAKVKVGITHLFAPGMNLFVKKSYRRIRDYLFYSRCGVRKYAWQSHPRIRYLKFALFSFSVVPMLRDAAKGYRELPDRAWLIHPFACFLLLTVYGAYIATTPRQGLSKIGISK